MGRGAILKISPYKHGEMPKSVMANGLALSGSLRVVSTCRYTAEQEVGAKSVSEVIYFNVTDSADNVLPLQLFAVTITPTNNQPPMVEVGPGVEVGGI